MSHIPFLMESSESKIWGQLGNTKINSREPRMSQSTHCSDHYSPQEITSRIDAGFKFLVPSSFIQLPKIYKFVLRVKCFPPEEAVGMNKKRKEFICCICTTRTMF